MFTQICLLIAVTAILHAINRKIAVPNSNQILNKIAHIDLFDFDADRTTALVFTKEICSLFSL